MKEILQRLIGKFLDSGFVSMDIHGIETGKKAHLMKAALGVPDVE